MSFACDTFVSDMEHDSVWNFSFLIFSVWIGFTISYSISIVWCVRVCFRMLFILSLCHAIPSSSTHSQTFHTHNFRISISINSLPIDVSPVCHHFTALQSNHFAHIFILLFQKLITICERQPPLDPFALIQPFYFLFRSIYLSIWPFVFSVFYCVRNFSTERERWICSFSWFVLLLSFSQLMCSSTKRAQIIALNFGFVSFVVRIVWRHWNKVYKAFNFHWSVRQAVIKLGAHIPNKTHQSVATVTLFAYLACLLCVCVCSSVPQSKAQTLKSA